MSKFPNHGLLARTAAASTRTAPARAQAGRGAHRNCSASSVVSAHQSAYLSAPSAVSSSSSASSQHTPATPFIGPLPFASPYTLPMAERTRSNRNHVQHNPGSGVRATDYVPLWRASQSTSTSATSHAIFDFGLDQSGLQHQLDSLALDPSSGLVANRHEIDTCLPVDLVQGPSARGLSIDLPTDSRPTHSTSNFVFVDVLHPTHSHRPSSPPLQHSGSDASGASTGEGHGSSSSSSYSKSSSQSSSSSSSQSSQSSSTSTVSLRPRLAFSAAAQDTQGSSSSGSSTPTNSGAQSPIQLDSAFLGPSSVTTAATYVSRVHLDGLQASSATTDSTSSDQPGLPPLWARSVSASRHRKFNYAFEHGAYGIPKRHPWAAVRGNGKKVAAQHPKPVVRTGAVGMLAAAADFLTGSVSASGPAAQKKKLGGEALIAEDGRRLGLNSPIREHGRIVQDRLESVQVGEDAYFLRSDSLGVADGVGGWASRAGADPALFSRLLMHFCAAELGKFDNLSADQLAADNGKLLKEWERVDPVEVMHTAWERCVRASRREGIMGSSTALIAVLRGDELRIANLGDCVLLIIRAGELLFRSTEQQHSFNFPVQLGMMGYTAESVTLAASRTLARDGFLQSGASDDLDDDAPCPLGTSDPEAMKKAKEAREAAQASNAGNEDADEAEWDEPRRDAGRWAVKVQKGDIIIVGSDGLVDNLFDEDIVEEVLKFAPPPPSSTDASQNAALQDDESTDGSDGISGTMEAEYQLPEDFCPQLVSEALCSRAKAVSEDSRAVSSPFQQRAMEEGLHYVGGKHDDISVVVAVVGDPSDQLANSGFAVASDQQEAPIASPVSA